MTISRGEGEVEFSISVNWFRLFCVVPVVLILWACISCLAWSNEAATFNKFKRPDQPAATIWDAAFADLRVTN